MNFGRGKKNVFEHPEHALHCVKKTIKMLSGLQIRVCNGKLFSSFLSQTYVVGTQKNHLKERVLLNTQNTCLN